jgi:hypothetical protein
LFFSNTPGTNTNEMMGKWKMEKRKISKNDIEKYIYIDF